MSTLKAERFHLYNFRRANFGRKEVLQLDGGLNVTATNIRIAISLSFEELGVSFHNYDFNTSGINMNGNISVRIRKNGFTAHVVMQPGLACQENVEVTQGEMVVNALFVCLLLSVYSYGSPTEKNEYQRGIGKAVFEFLETVKADFNRISNHGTPNWTTGRVSIGKFIWKRAPNFKKDGKIRVNIPTIFEDLRILINDRAVDNELGYSAKVTYIQPSADIIVYLGGTCEVTVEEISVPTIYGLSIRDLGQVSGFFGEGRLIPDLKKLLKAQLLRVLEAGFKRFIEKDRATICSFTASPIKV